MEGIQRDTKRYCTYWVSKSPQPYDHVARTKLINAPEVNKTVVMVRMIVSKGLRGIQQERHGIFDLGNYTEFKERNKYDGVE